MAETASHLTAHSPVHVTHLSFKIQLRNYFLGLLPLTLRVGLSTPLCTSASLCVTFVHMEVLCSASTAHVRVWVSWNSWSCLTHLYSHAYPKAQSIFTTLNVNERSSSRATQIAKGGVLHTEFTISVRSQHVNSCGRMWSIHTARSCNTDGEDFLENISLSCLQTTNMQFLSTKPSETILSCIIKG